MPQHNHNNNKGYLKRRILIPLAVVILITVSVFSVATVWHVLTAIDREAEMQVDFARQTYLNDIENDIRKMAATLDVLMQNEALRKAYQRQDRSELLALASPIYQSLNSELHITHFYFNRPDRVNLLRIHAPERHGDRIDRFTTLEAERRGELYAGLELGVLGTFTLRVVKPWYHKGELLGYLELGEEIDHIVDELRETLDVGLFIFINKKHLNREEWETGMHMLGRSSDWNRYANHILVSSSVETLHVPEQLEDQLKQNEQITLNRTFEVTVPEERYKATFLPLYDAQEQRVGMMLLMNPIEHWFTQGKQTILGASLFFMLLGGGVFILFYRLADSTEKTLQQTQEELLDEARENDYLHIQHIDDLEQKNRLLEQTKAEIQASRDQLETAQRIAHIGSWIWEIRDNRLEWSNEVYRIFGYQPGEIEATYPAFLHTIHPDERAVVEDAVAKTLENGSHYEVEHRIIRPDGTVRIVREEGELMYDDNHQPLRMVGTVHDITKRRQAEQLTRQLGQIFDNASNEIYLIEPQSLNIVQANHTAAKHLDYSPQELNDLRYTDIATGMTEERFQELCTPLLQGKSKEIHFESFHSCKDGNSYPVEIRLQHSDLDNHPLFIAIVLDITERMAQEKALRHQALHDNLTKLPNRYLLNQHLEEAISDAAKNEHPVTLMQLNLDDFGAINDTLGHDNGDQLLSQLAKRLQQCVRQGDFVARIGGDEFAVLLPHAGVGQLDTLVAHIQQSLNRPFVIGDLSLSIEATIGIAVYPEHADSARALLQHADVALKRAKAFHSGTEVYHADFDPFSVRRLMLNNQMRHAIENGEFELYFQPKVDARSGKIVEAEALIRWQHPEHGDISPAEFIPLAEKTGYIRQITLWVIEEAARLIGQWNEPELKVSVNLSARNLQDPDLLGYIIDTVGKYRIDPRKLCFEITETAIMIDPDYTHSLLLDISQLGHPIAIDDYGTGYSSLAYLQRLPAGELKIDASFILHMLDNHDNSVIVHSTIELAHNLSMSVTAEGVESQALAEALKEMGVDLLQGFHFSRPLPASEFIALLHNS